MHDIGHLEFGELHRPIAFEGFKALAAGRTPREPDYWLAYWIAAYRHIGAQAEVLHIVPQEPLGTDSARIMNELCARIGLDAAGTDFTGYFRPVKQRADTTRFAPALLAEARTLYDALVDKASTERLVSNG
jgi:hypothetical protein